MNQALRLATVTLLAAVTAQAETGAVATGSVEDDAWWKFGGNAFGDAFGLDGWQNSFRLGRWQATVDLGADGSYQDTSSPGRPDLEYWSRLTAQGLTIRNQGLSILDPRLLTGTATVRFGFRQVGQSISGEDDTRIQTGDITDYHVGATLLAEKPYNATLQANRSEYVGTQPGGGTTASVTTSQGALLNWREDSILRDRDLLNFFSATLQAHDESIEQVSRSAGNEFRRNEDRRVLAFDAHNGFETGDTNLRLEDIDVTNRLVPASSYRSRYADLGHSQDFGAFLDHQSNTHVNYSERSGGFSVTTLNMDQRFDLTHSEYLSSSYGLLYSSSESAIAETVGEFADASVQYTPFSNVTTSVQAFGNRQSFNPGTIEGHGLYLNASYEHWLPGAGNLSASLGGGYSINDSQLPSGNVPVIDQPYQAPPEFGAGQSVELTQPNVVTDTIVVFSVRGGARLPTTLGVDYEVDVQGTRTLIVPLASSAVILPGDPLEISYLYLVDADLKARVTSGSLSLVADWQWIALSFTHDATTTTPISGSSDTTLLGDQNRDRLALGLRGDWGTWIARADSSYQRTRDTRLQYDELRNGGNLTWQPNWMWALNLNASHSDTRFLDTDRRTKIADFRVGCSWTSERGWWGNGHVAYRTLDDSDLAPEQLLESRVQIRRSWPDLDLGMMFGLGRRTRGPITTDYADVHISVSRQFR